MRLFKVNRDLQYTFSKLSYCMYIIIDKRSKMYILMWSKWSLS